MYSLVYQGDKLRQEKKVRQRQTDTEGGQSEGENTTTTDLVSKKKERRRKDRLVAKGQRRKYGAKDEVK